MIFLKVDSARDNILISNLSKNAMVRLQLSISLARLEKLLDHSLRTLLSSLNLALMTNVFEAPRRGAAPDPLHNP